MSPDSEDEDHAVRERGETRLVSMRQTDDYDKRIDRATRFGNPYKTHSAGGDYTREESIRRYRNWFETKVSQNEEFREAVEDLRGKTLSCWCVPKPCHGDVILDYLDDTEEDA